MYTYYLFLTIEHGVYQPKASKIYTFQSLYGFNLINKGTIIV